MKAIRNSEDIKNLKTDDRLVELIQGKANFYRFLCFHPRNQNYVILLDCCEQPVRFYCSIIIDRFYTDVTERDVINYRKSYVLKKLDEFEQALSMLGDKSNLNDEEQ